MNVLFISPNSPLESIGGIERYISNLIQYCQDKKEINTYIMLPSATPMATVKKGNVTIFYENSINLEKNSPNKDILVKANLFKSRVTEIILKHEIEVICAENFHVGLPAAFSLLLNMAAAANDVPVILRLHSFASTPLQIELVNQLPWSRISCVSKSVAGDCFQKGADISILTTDYLGVNIQEFNGLQNEQKDERKNLREDKFILTASRILHGTKSILVEKGIVNLIQAFSKLSPRFPNIYLIIAIGKAPANLKREFEATRLMLEGFIKLNNIEAKTIIKMADLDEMPQIYREADIFVLPSENETFGQVFLEAMSSGLPVVGTNTGGIPEIISDSYNGYLIPPGDSSFLAQILEKLVSDKYVGERLKNSGIKTVNAKFSSQTQFTLFMSMLATFKRNDYLKPKNASTYIRTIKAI
jgi:glycosyltransferase involved in cell wall biosynthesis